MYKTKNGNIELRIVGYDEPNNGRELHIVELYINGENCTSKYFKDNWNRVNFNLKDYLFESPNFKYVFIPAESVSFIINTETLDSTPLPYKGVSTALFQKNEFIGNNLIIHYSDEIIEVNLENK